MTAFSEIQQLKLRLFEILSSLPDEQRYPGENDLICILDVDEDVKAARRRQQLNLVD